MLGRIFVDLKRVMDRTKVKMSFSEFRHMAVKPMVFIL